MRCNSVAASRGRFITNHGDPIHVIYTPELQPNGVIKLVEFGKENTDEIIHSYYESTTLEAILMRFNNGDLSALNRYQPIYADISNAPKSLAEGLQAVINSRHAFDALPADVKSQFDNDFNKWLMSAGSESWMSAMSAVVPDFKPADPDVKPADPDVKE